MNKIKIISLLIIMILIGMLYFVFTSFDKERKRTDIEVMHHANQCAQIVLESLLESDITEIPLDTKERVNIIDKYVYANRLRVFDEFNANYQSSNSDKTLKPYYPNLVFGDDLVSGLNKNSLIKDEFNYYVLWKNEKAVTWRGYKIICSLTSGKTKKVKLEGLTNNWVDLNLEFFPYEGSKTYSIIVK